MIKEIKSKTTNARKSCIPSKARRVRKIRWVEDHIRQAGHVRHVGHEYT